MAARSTGASIAQDHHRSDSDNSVETRSENSAVDCRACARLTRRRRKETLLGRGRPHHHRRLWTGESVRRADALGSATPDALTGCTNRTRLPDAIKRKAALVQAAFPYRS